MEKFIIIIAVCFLIILVIGIVIRMGMQAKTTNDSKHDQPLKKSISHNVQNIVEPRKPTNTDYSSPEYPVVDLKQFKKEYYSKFRNLPTRQKEAIFVSLICTIKTPNFSSHKKNQRLQEVETILDLNSELANLTQFNNDEQLIYTVLNMLPDEIKDWFAVNLYALIYLDGEPSKTEMENFQIFMMKMNITEQKLEQLLKDISFAMTITDKLVTKT